MTATARAVELAEIAAEAAADKLASDIIAYDVSEQLVITDVFLLCSAANDRQVQAIVDAIEEKLRQAGARPVRREGEREGRWVLLDYLDIVIHIQHAEERVYYALERLWKDCPRIPLPEPVGAVGGAGSAGTGCLRLRSGARAEPWTEHAGGRGRPGAEGSWPVVGCRWRGAERRDRAAPGAAAWCQRSAGPAGAVAARADPWNVEGRFQGQSDIPLDETGEQQAERAARLLAALQPNAIFSSDLGRAMATAAPLARLTGLTVITDKDLRERYGGPGRA